MSSAGWVAVMPIKPLERGKSRLRGAVPEGAHADLVLSMAVDTVVATAACATISRIVVVTDDARVRVTLTALGAQCLPDRPAGGLNAAFRFGAATVTGPVVALAADLPALRAGDLTDALARAAAHRDTRATGARAGRGTWTGRAFVADAGRAGTVLLTAFRGADLLPSFGPDSAAAHRASGAVELDGGWPSLRRDVDTAADLAAAAALGLGPATASVLDPR